MWILALAIVLLFSACVVDIAVALDWIPTASDFLQTGIDYAKALAKRFIADERPEIVVLYMLLACAGHTAIISFFPMRLMHWLRSDGMVRFAVSQGWAKKLDAMMIKIRRHPALALILKIVDALTRLALLPVQVGLRLALDPQNSRLAIASLFAPVAAAVVLWGIVDAFPIERLIPEGFLDSPGSGRDKEKIVWVSIGVLLGVGGAYEVGRRWIAPDLARWFVGGNTTPLAYQWGLGAAVGASLVLAGLHLDGNLGSPPVCGELRCSNGETMGSPLKPIATQKTPDDDRAEALMARSMSMQRSLGIDAPPPPPPRFLQPRAVHVAALFVACAAITALHLGLPVFNRREFAVVRLTNP